MKGAHLTKNKFVLSPRRAFPLLFLSVLLSPLPLAWAEPPAITEQPASQTVQVNQSVTFSVRATGTPPLRYQWFENGVAIPGADSPDYTISAVSIDQDEAQFHAQASNDEGSADSSAAALRVYTPAIQLEGHPWGIQLVNLPSQREIEEFIRVGIKRVRLNLDPGRTPRQGEGYNFNAYDSYLNNLHAQGIRVIADLFGSNPPRTPVERAEFARWARFAVNRYSGRGILWTFWNEPHDAAYWDPPDPREYALAAVAVGRAIKGEFPNEFYAVGDCVPFEEIEPFIEGMLQGGIGLYADAVSVHPYQWNLGPPEGAVQLYNRVRALIDRYAPPDKNIGMINTELGYPSAAVGKDPVFHGDPITQAKYVGRQMGTDLVSGVPVTTWYAWRDFLPGEFGEPDWSHACGLVQYPLPAIAYKPSWFAASTMNGFLEGYTYQARLPLGEPEDYVLQFTNGVRQRWVVWRTAKTARINLPLAPGNYTITNYLGDSSYTVTVGQGGYDMTLTDALQYIVPE